MIIAKVNEGHIQLMSDGTLEDLKTDFLVLVEGVYRALAEKNEEAAESFKKDIVENIEYAFMTEEEFVKTKGSEIFNNLLQELKDGEEKDENIGLES